MMKCRVLLFQVLLRARKPNSPFSDWRPSHSRNDCKQESKEVRRSMILRSFGLLFASPVTLIYVASLLLRGNGVASLALQIQMGWAYMTIFPSRTVLHATAATVLFLETCVLTKLSFLWGLSVCVLIFISNHILCSGRGFPGWEGLRITLQPYEISVARMLFALIVSRTEVSLRSVYGGAASSPPSEYEYSVGQSLLVVDICLSGLVLTLLISEAIAYCAHFFRARSSHGRQDAQYNGKVTLLAPTSGTQPSMFAAALLLSAVVVAHSLVLPQLAHHGVVKPVHWVLGFVFRAPGYYELQLCVYWLLLIVGAVTSGYFAAVRYHWPRTCSRKIFHALVVALFLPAMHGSGALLVPRGGAQTSSWMDDYQYRRYSFLVLSLGVAVGIFLLSEYLRMRFSVSSVVRKRERGVEEVYAAGDEGPCTRRIPWMGKAMRAVDGYMQLFLCAEKESVDGGVLGLGSGVADGIRDNRPRLELSHISLLLGCAGPVWMYVALCEQLQLADHPCATEGTMSLQRGMAAVGGAECSSTMDMTTGFHTSSMLLLSLLPYVGILTLGIGDAAAAVVGKLFGRLRWSTVLCMLGLRGLENNHRTVEGSLACFVSMSVASMWALHSQCSSINVAAGDADRLLEVSSTGVSVTVVCIVLLCMLIVTMVEAFTTANDNIVLPIGLSLLVMLSAHSLAFL